MNHSETENSVGTTENSAVETTTEATAQPATEATPSTTEVTSEATQTPTELKDVDYTSTSDNNAKVVKQKDTLSKEQRKKYGKTNIVGVTKSVTNLNQDKLTETLKATAQEAGFELKLTRGRLSNMINGSCNVTPPAERACKALLKAKGFNAVEKSLEVEATTTEESATTDATPTASPTAVA